MDTSSESHKKNNGVIIKVLIVTGIVSISAGLGFLGGVTFQKNQKTTQIQAGAGLAQGGSGFGGMRRGGTIGDVTAVSATNISVQNARTGTTSTLTIDSATTVTDNGTAKTVADIKVGDTVLVTTSTTDTSKATRISLNPTAGFGPPPSSGASVQTQTN